MSDAPPWWSDPFDDHTVSAEPHTRWWSDAPSATMEPENRASGPVGHGRLEGACMPVPHERSYRRRSHYRLGTELSGLERPGQWLRMTATVIATLLALFLVAFLAFG